MNNDSCLHALQAYLTKRGLEISIEVTVALTHVCLSSCSYAACGGINFIYIILAIILYYYIMLTLNGTL